MDTPGRPESRQALPGDTEMNNYRGETARTADGRTEEKVDYKQKEHQVHESIKIAARGKIFKHDFLFLRRVNGESYPPFGALNCCPICKLHFDAETILEKRFSCRSYLDGENADFFFFFGHCGRVLGSHFIEIHLAWPSVTHKLQENEATAVKLGRRLN